MSDTPSYTAEPGPDEHRLGIADRTVVTSISPSGTLIDSGPGISIALKNQRRDARRATYGRNGSVVGEVSLSRTHDVASVSVYLGGRATYNSGTTTILESKVLDESITIWEADGSGTCPAVLPFNFVFPENFVDSRSRTSFPLPPSYDPLQESSSPIQIVPVKCAYRLRVHVDRSGWMPSQTMIVDIEYAPRTYPSRPVIETAFPFFDTVKSSPEEWVQSSTSAVLSLKPNATLDPIDCDLVIPSVETFTKRQKIPFFLQLRGSTESILALYCFGDRGLVHRMRVLLAARTPNSSPIITISVQRHVVVVANNAAPATWSYTIGTGSLRPVPPGYGPPEEEGDSLTVNYEGDIEMDPHVEVGGFDIGRIRVSDTIELSIRPSGAAANRYGFASLVHSVPVEIITG